jgi:tRNA (mo5U34)-methyltransferase
MSRLRRLISSLKGGRDDDRRFQFRGFDENRVSAPSVDALADEELKALNRILEWSCFTADGAGRRFGRRAWAGKRETPQPIPDPRIVLLNQKIPLAGLHVLEVGCFEGVHTIGLSRFAGKVTAVDARIENVVKTMVRCGFFECTPHVFKCDLEKAEDAARLPQADVLHHVGVFYHLVDPVAHLRTFSRLARWV